MQELINQLVTVSAGLLILGASWFVNFLTGVSKYIFNNEKWSWKRTLESVMKAVLMCLATVAWVGVMYGVSWFAGKCGADISAIMDGISVAGVCAGIIGGSAYFLGKAYTSIINFVNTQHVEVTFQEPKYDEIAKGVFDLFDTILGKTVKEQLKEDGLPALEGEDVKPGKGAYYPANTYPEPYRSAAQDSMTDPSTCYNRECVSYCAWKIKELKGAWPTRTGSMSAKYWIDRLPSWGYNRVSAPRDGGKYIGVSTAGTYGHVVWFEGGNMVSEYNYSTMGGFGVRNINLSQYVWYEIAAPSTPSPAPTKSNEEVAKEVIRGDWGNNPERRQRLEAAGYDYNTIQGIVDQMLGGGGTPEPAPAPAPEPSINLGDTVTAWGRGNSNSLGNGKSTKEFGKTQMKVILIANGRYALNQYNKGTVGQASDVTGWWPKEQISK